jgi:hypothetical protein
MHRTSVAEIAAFDTASIMTSLRQSKAAGSGGAFRTFADPVDVDQNEVSPQPYNV